MAAKYPETFYGQLAGEKTGRTASFNMREASQNLVPLKKPMANVAVHLSNAGLKKESEAFLLRLMAHSQTPQELESLAALARRLGKNNIAIKVAQELQKKHGVGFRGISLPAKSPRIE